jgi:hypothetical protein
MFNLAQRKTNRLSISHERCFPAIPTFEPSLTMPDVHRSSKPIGYQAMIQADTGAPERLLPTLERIMRRDVFHGTLDWQSSAEFTRGARQALALYRRDAAFYDAETAQLAAFFVFAQAEQTLARTRADGNANAVAEAERALALAKEGLDAAHAALESAHAATS